MENRGEAIPELLEILDYTVSSAETLSQDPKYLVHLPAIYLLAYFGEKLEVDYSCVWDELPRYCSLIHPVGLKEDIEKAVADGKVMELIADLDFMNNQLSWWYMTLISSKF